MEKQRWLNANSVFNALLSLFFFLVKSVLKLPFAPFMQGRGERETEDGSCLVRDNTNPPPLTRR